MAKLFKEKSNSESGFTLVEVLIYVGIIGMVIFSFVSFSLSVSRSNNKAFAVQEVGAGSRFVLKEMKQEIKRAEGVISPGAGSSSDVLILDMPDSEEDLSFEVRDDSLGIRRGVGSFTPWVSDKVRFSNISFANLGPDQENRIISIKFQAEYNNDSGTSDFDFSHTIRTAVGVKSLKH
ncbi:MAG TPA: prepilin-type N-terminal cleavage/methylation domain-containing protein [Patescibacteria group bacterium]|nr:prepilin-type N-terminal cleavage/methylation domain-containing protein [Patescibacteria group bacterium]